MSKGLTDEEIESELNAVKPLGKISVTSKIAPFIGKDNNRKGYHIGDYKILVDTNELPFTNFDQVDHFIYNLFDYVRTRKNIKNFFIYHPETMEFIPARIEKNIVGGKRRTKRNKSKRKKTKTIKRK